MVQTKDDRHPSGRLLLRANTGSLGNLPYLLYSGVDTVDDPSDLSVLGSPRAAVCDKTKPKSGRAARQQC